MTSASDPSPWERFAREDAEYYIWTREGIDFSSPEGKRLFAESGVQDAAMILRTGSPAGRRAALEIGCGVGRLSLPMSQHFEHLTAVDISPSMLAQLEQRCAESNVENIRPVEAAGKWDDRKYDFVYSWIVFQHIEDPRVLEEYFQRIATSLAVDGIFFAHVDTRSRTPLYHLRNAAPDWMLPRPWRRGIRRIRRAPESVMEMVCGAGLAVASEVGAGTGDHILLLRTRAS